MRFYWDAEHSLNVDRDINAGINIKRVGRGLFPTLKRRKGKPVEIAKSTTNSTLFAQRLPLGEGSSGSVEKCARSLHLVCTQTGVGSSRKKSNCTFAPN
ncbi:hypothetical protein NIES4073_08450 [Kalymmatonema gypsitolerans NIES-4073]|nr:hypothetical protein NIES4073_08450 [Scytonema sp. NIES-4073]